MLHETHTNAMHKLQARNHTHNHTPLHNDHSRQHTGVTTARWAAWRLAALAAPAPPLLSRPPTLTGSPGVVPPWLPRRTWWCCTS